MATKLVKPITREVVLSDSFGNDGVAILKFYHDRLEIRKKGTSRTLSIEWNSLNKVLKLPLKAPAKYAANPLGWIVEKTI